MTNKTSTPNLNVYLVDDIQLHDFDATDIERYEFTENKARFVEFMECRAAEDREVIDLDLDATMEKLQEDYPELYEEWINDIHFEEQFEVPLMNALRYFPGYVQFEERDRYLAGSNTVSIR